jgi:A/G-specific adenine glycosylase
MNTNTFHGFSAKLFQKAIIRWFNANQRDLPWRKKSDAYSIWISEVMLQQTQVQQVIPYYRKFLKHFPSIRHLSRATIDEVLKVWEGLGYYKRAVQLHESAKIIVTKHKGKVPDDYMTLRNLPGFGDYTTGAVLSIAFQKCYTAVDSNVTRVISRLFNFKHPVYMASNKRILYEYVKSLLPEKNISLFNQSLMELGAMICKPNKPNCLQCPVKLFCRAFITLKEPSLLPVKKPKSKRPVYTTAIGIIIKNKRVLIAKRPADTLLGNLWEFPGGKQKKGENLLETCMREIKEEVGIQVNVQKKLTRIQHQYSHFKVNIHVYLCEYVSGHTRPIGCAKVRWITINDLNLYAFPRANQKIISQLLKEPFILSVN